MQQNSLKERNDLDLDWEERSKRLLHALFTLVRILLLREGLGDLCVKSSDEVPEPLAIDPERLAIDSNVYDCMQLATGSTWAL